MPRANLLLLTAAAALLIGQSAPFPDPYNSEKNPGDGPMPAQEAAAKMTLPPGFHATVFAAEPDVQNPIAMTWDRRGRLWVAENYTYAERPMRFDMSLRDRVLIFEDADGDGRFDKRTVFTDEVQMVTSVEVGVGGVWLMCPPRLVFVPDANGDGVPDGPAQTVLDGFTTPDTSYHNFANGLRMGPDGWLYGRCGHSAPGDIGAPGSSAAARVPLRGTMWRYHPTRKVFESLATGTTNPWGHDWDPYGELFFVNTVNGHLWHGITGAHFPSGTTLDPNPRAYDLIEQHADHYHFDIGQGWTKSRAGQADEYGGGHAHIGCIIYQGDNWPPEYRGKLFTVNMHGRRINQDILERTGSGYVGHHGRDFMISPDTWFRGLDLSCGPDGSVMLIDWSDTGECHEATGVHRTSGRIYRISYGEPKRNGPADLTALSPVELVALHTHANEWFPRQARIELTDRAAAGADVSAAITALRKMADGADVVHRLRAIWTLYCLNAVDAPLITRMIADPNEHVRVWGIRLLTDAWPLDNVDGHRPARVQASLSREPLQLFTRMAAEDPSGLVRLTLASLLQRLPVDARMTVAAALMTHTADADDHNLPLLVWYGLTPVVDSDPDGLARMAVASSWPTVRRDIARALAEQIDTSPAAVNVLLTGAGAAALRGDVVLGITDGLAGVRKAARPAAWDRFVAQFPADTDDELAGKLRGLSVVFGDGRALDEVKATVANGKADVGVRRAALATLIASKPDDLQATCLKFLENRQLNGVAVRGLAQFDDPAVGKKIALAYRKFSPMDRPAVIDTLSSRPTFAREMLKEVAAGHIPRADVTPFHARQLRAFNDSALNEELTSVWGELRDSSADKKAAIANFKAILTPDKLAAADREAGRAVFATTCAVCHKLYGQGGEIGPDLTGAGRDNIDYLLENIVDPSAVVAADFKLSIVTLKDGRILTGMMPATTAGKTTILRTMTEKLTLDRGDIASVVQSPQSLMPEGQLEAMGPEKMRDLIAYLMQR